MHTRPKNPSPETRNIENKAEPKTIKLTTYTNNKDIQNKQNIIYS